MKVEVAQSPGWPGYQFVIKAETDSDSAIIGQVQRDLDAKKGRPLLEDLAEIEKRIGGK